MLLFKILTEASTFKIILSLIILFFRCDFLTRLIFLVIGGLLYYSKWYIIPLSHLLVDTFIILDIILSVVTDWTKIMTGSDINLKIYNDSVTGIKKLFDEFNYDQKDKKISSGILWTNWNEILQFIQKELEERRNIVVFFFRALHSIDSFLANCIILVAFSFYLFFSRLFLFMIFLEILITILEFL